MYVRARGKHVPHLLRSAPICDMSVLWGFLFVVVEVLDEFQETYQETKPTQQPKLDQRNMQEKTNIHQTTKKTITNRQQETKQNKTKQNKRHTRQKTQSELHVLNKFHYLQ